MANVVLEHVKKMFGNFVAVEDADFHIQEGEFFTLLGPSGCGKTTTLRMIAGFSYPSEGTIRFGERDVTMLAPNKRDIGMVFQNYALFPHLTIGENVAFGLKIRKVGRKECEKRVARALEMVHLGSTEKRRVHEISGGQQQRVALARALVIEPSILLLDEPLSNLDAKLRDDTRSEIKRLQREFHITTVYVTHDQAEALAVSDRILIMKDGKTQQLGTPYEVYAKPANDFVATFIGKHNLLSGVVDRREGEAVFVRLTDGSLVQGFAGNAAGDAVLSEGASVQIAVRPESLQVAKGQPENVLHGTALHMEFTGMSATYLLSILGVEWKAVFVEHIPDTNALGKAFAVYAPPEAVYFLPGRAAS